MNHETRLARQTYRDRWAASLLGAGNPHHETGQLKPEVAEAIYQPNVSISEYFTRLTGHLSRDHHHRDIQPLCLMNDQMGHSTSHILLDFNCDRDLCIGIAHHSITR